MNNTNTKPLGIPELLAFVLKNGASDLHLTSGHEPMIRINGDLVPIEYAPPSRSQLSDMLRSIMTEEQFMRYEKDQELDFAINYGATARFRVNAFFTIAGPAAVFRCIPVKVRTLDELKAPDKFKEFAELERGLVLVTGPTGSGKSTTLAAMIDYINESSSRHIITIEDPVEFIHKSKKSLVNHREVGKNTHSFANALKSALREDPDVILVGEMRDRETISLALTAAETGHLVFGTLHTSSAAKTINRIIDVFPAGDKDMVRSMIAGSLKAVIAQALIPSTAGGRVAAYEVLVGLPAVCNLIREDVIHQIDSIMVVNKKHGMQTMASALEDLVRNGLIDPMYIETAKDSDDKVLANKDNQTKTNKTEATTKPSVAPLPKQEEIVENKIEVVDNKKPISLL